MEKDAGKRGLPSGEIESAVWEGAAEGAFIPGRTKAGNHEKNRFQKDQSRGEADIVSKGI